MSLEANTVFNQNVTHWNKYELETFHRSHLTCWGAIVCHRLLSKLYRQQTRSEKVTDPGLVSRFTLVYIIHWTFSPRPLVIAVTSGELSGRQWRSSGATSSYPFVSGTETRLSAWGCENRSQRTAPKGINTHATEWSFISASVVPERQADYLRGHRFVPSD